MKKGRIWMLALALASGSPLSAEEGSVMDALNLSEGVVRTEPTSGRGTAEVPPLTSR